MHKNQLKDNNFIFKDNIAQCYDFLYCLGLWII